MFQTRNGIGALGVCGTPGPLWRLCLWLAARPTLHNLGYDRTRRRHWFVQTAQHVNLFGMAAKYFNQANRSNARRGLTAFILLECPPPPAYDPSCFFLAEVEGLTDRLHKCRIFPAQLLEGIIRSFEIGAGVSCSGW